MKSLRLGYVPTQLSDRSYGSSSHYGGTSGTGSGYKSYDYSGLGSSSYGGSSSSSYRPPASSSADRSLNYLSSSGSVSSLKGKFDRSTGPSTRESSSYGSSSLDRYGAGSRSGSNSALDYSSKLGTGYTSDLDLRGGSSSYGSGTYGSSSGTGRSYSGTSYSNDRSSSPVYGSRSSLSRPDYTRSSSTRDYSSSSYGGSGTGTSGTASSRTAAKSSSYNLTPFETRRSTTKASDLNLTPFSSTSKNTDSSALPPRPSYERERQSSTPSEQRSQSSSGTTSRKDEVKSSRADLSDSSDSAEEPPPGARRNPDVRYLTSRATSPMEVDRDAASRKLDRNKNRNRLIARTKTKTYPVLDKKRRRQLKNIQLQVDIDELDKFAGRVRINREKLAKHTAENKYGIPRTGPSVAAVSSAIEAPASQRQTPFSKRPAVQDDEPYTPPVILPKQSGFVPKDRKSTILTDVLPDDDSRIIGSRKQKSQEEKDNEVMSPPKQSSFLERKWQQDEKDQKELQQEQARKQAEAAEKLKKKNAADNLTLKDSIDKVRSWKKQMQHLDEPEPESCSIFAKKDYQKKPSRSQPQREESPPPAAKQTNALSPPDSVRSPSEGSEIGFSRDMSPNVKNSAGKTKSSKEKKSTNGEDTVKNNQLDARYKASKQKSGKLDRSPSPYDDSEKNRLSSNNCPTSNHRLTILRSTSQGGYTASNESLGGDISSAASDDDGALNRTGSMASLGGGGTDSWPRRSLLQPRVANSMTNLSASSVTSLPDLVTSSETAGKNRGYIGKLRDIDSFLGFGETDEEFSDRQASGEDSGAEDGPRIDDEKTMNKRNTNRSARSGSLSGRRSMDRRSPRNSVSPMRRPTSDDVIYIGDTEDIDEILGKDLVTTYLGVTLSKPEQKKTSTTTCTPLHLNLGRPSSAAFPGVAHHQADISSTESLLDTPVPDTPDIPLSPVPAFFSPSSSSKSSKIHSKAMTTDHLNRDPCTTNPNSSKKSEDFPVDLDYLANRSDNPHHHDTSESFLRTTSWDEGSKPNSTRRRTPPETDTLVDLSYDDEDGPGEIMESQTAKIFYPPEYSHAAVAEAKAKQSENGQVTISELVDICRKQVKKKPPWVEDEEDRRFTGYSDIRTLLEYMDVDVKKLEDCAIELYRLTGGSNAAETYLQPQSSFDDDLTQDMETSAESDMSLSIESRLRLSVRVHAFIDKLLNSSGQELRRALFSLKQIFKTDKELTTEFIYSDGLACLVKIGMDANHSYQSYILRALGQLMLYIEGMNGVVSNNNTIQWLYNLTSSNIYPLVKTALRLLVMFVDYSDCNAFLLLQAVSAVSISKGAKVWCNLVDLVKEKNPGQTDLSIMAMTLINKTMASIPDQDTFYDLVDALEDQDMEKTIQNHMKKKGTRPDLLQQLGIYESMLQEEDSRDSMHLDLIENVRGRRSRSRTQGRKSKRYMKSAGRLKKGVPSKNDMVLGPKGMSAEFSKPMIRKWKKAYDEEEEEQSWAKDFKKDLKHRSNEAEPLSPTSGSQPVRHVLRSTSNDKDAKQPMSPPGDNSATRTLTVIKNNLKPRVQPQPMAPPPIPREDEFTGLLDKAKDGLSSSSRGYQKKEEEIPEPVEVKPVKSESEQQWELIEKSMSRPLKIKDMDFTDLTEVDDINYVNAQPVGGAVPVVQGPALNSKVARFGSQFGSTAQQQAKQQPPGPPGAPPPPPPPPGLGMPPPPPPPMMGPPPPMAPAPPISGPPAPTVADASKAGRKTLRLHWREGKGEFYTPSGRTNDTIWSKMSREMVNVKIDKEALAELFETKTSDLKLKAQQQDGSKKEVTVLDSKRSNAINIGLTALPPPRTIKTAILNMDSLIMNRECIERILTTMLPTEEEKTKMMEAQVANPDLPLGTAEQFLLTISSISELEARLQLWAFTIDYEGIEGEIANPVSDLKLGMEELRRSRTLRYVLAMLLSLGNCLNNAQAKGFTIDYLSHVPEVKDTVNKHSLLFHLVTMVIEQFPDSTDLFSEIPAVSRCSKVDWDELAEKLAKLEQSCKTSWDHLRAVVKRDNNLTLKNKLSEMLADFAERIMLLKIAHRRIINRFCRFLLYFGYAPDTAQEVKVNVFCKTVVEFALEYRTVREKILLQREKKVNQSERRMSRGKVTLDDNALDTKSKTLDYDRNGLRRGQRSIDQDDKERQQILPTGKLAKYPSLSRLESRRGVGGSSGHGSESESVYDTGDEDLMEAVMRTAAASPDRRPRDKRKTKESADRRSWRSTTSVSRDRNGY